MATMTYNTKTLKAALAAVAPYSNAKHEWPILGYVRLTPDTVEATDLDTYATYDVGGGGDGAILLPLKALKTAISAIKTADVTITAGDDFKAKVGPSTLQGIDPADYPQCAAFDATQTVTVDDFLPVLRRVIVAASKDLTRPVLCAVYLDPDGHMVTTDSYRLHVARLDHGLTESVNLPAYAMRAIAKSKHKGAVTLSVGMDHTLQSDCTTLYRLTAGPLTVQGRVVDGKYPNWKQLTPETLPGEITLDREELSASAVAIDKLLGKKHSAPMRINYGGNGHADVTMLHMDAGNYNETIGCSGHNWSFEVGFNPAFVAEALVMGDSQTVTLHGISELKLVVFGEPDSFALVMPIRLND